ncbi:MAG TPA: hypothetical protein VG860_05030 [Terriglobia bacterium]|nr:hypothetical protein [Terriglobia bacterium]
MDGGSIDCGALTGYGGGSGLGGSAESTAQCPGNVPCVYENNPWNEIYEDAFGRILYLNCNGQNTGNMVCVWSHWSQQFVQNGNMEECIGDAAWMCIFNQVYQTASGPVNAAAVGTAAVALLPAAVGEAAVLSEGLGWNISGTWGAFRQFTIYNTYGNLLSLGVDSVNGWHIGILASETGHSLWHIPLNPLNWVNWW